MAVTEDPKYIPRKVANASYRPNNYLMSPGLKRARQPYRLQNAITGITLAAFGVGVWAYSISAVKQDVFDDVDEEARALAGNSSTAGRKSIEDEAREKAAAASAQSIPAQPVMIETSMHLLDPPTTSETFTDRGVLSNIFGARLRHLDPSRRTLVWGAPPVDNVGRMGDSTSHLK